MKKPEKLCSMHKNGPRREYKKLVRRARRRAERRDPGDAPRDLKAFVRGWY